MGAIDEAAADYRTATQSIATGDKLLADDQRHEDQIASQFRVGQADRVTLVTAEVEVATTALSRFDSVVRQQQAIGALEDALQQPLFNSGRWPIVPTDQSTVPSPETSPS
jgi:outer membrane protein, heavy metal efflux system